MGGYTLNFDVKTAGVPDLQKIDAVIAALQSHTRATSAELKLFGDVLKLDAQAGQTLESSLNAVKSSTQSFSAELRGGIASLTQATVATNAQTAAVVRLNSSLGHTVPQVAAAGAAIRVFEGALPIRAVERFAVTTLGLGPILQAAFPIFGLVALAEMVERTWEKFDPLTKAEKEAAKVTKELDAEFQRLGERFEKLKIDEITDKFGKLAGAKLAAFYSDTSLAEDQARIKTLGRLIDEEKSKLASDDAAAKGTLIGTLAASGGNPLSGLVSGTAGAFLSSRASAAHQIKISTLQDEQDALTQKAKVQSEETTKHTADADKDARRESAEAAKRAATAIREFNRELLSLSGVGQSGLLALQRRKQDDISGLKESGILTPARLAQLDDAEAQGFAQLIAEEAVKARKRTSEAGARTERSQIKIEDLPYEAGRLSAEFAKQYARGFAEDQSNNASQNGPRSLLIGGVSVSNGLPGVESTQQAQTRAAIGTSHAERMVGINDQDGNPYDNALKISAIQEQAANEKLKLDLQEAEFAKDKQQAIFDAQFAHETTLQELRLKNIETMAEYEKRREDDFANGALGLFHAGVAGKAPAFLRNFGMQQGDEVIKNIARSVWENGGSSVADKLQVSKGPLGTLLQGTIFGPKPALSSTDQQLVAANATLRQIAVNTARTAGRAAGGSGSSIPGIGGGSDDSGATDAQGNAIPDVAVYGSIPGGGAVNIPGVSAGAAGSTTQGGIAGGIATGVTVAAAAYGAYTGISNFLKPGAKNKIAGIGEIAGSAATLDPEPISKAILGGIAVGSALVSALFGDPRQNRSNQITKELGNSTYQAPTALNETVGTNGNYTDYDQYGNLRSSPFAGRPMVTQPYSYYHNGTYIQYPGTVISPFQNPNLGIPTQTAQGGQSPNNVPNITINAVDAPSFMSMLSKPEYAMAVVQAHTNAIQNGNGQHAVRTMAEALGIR